MVSSQDEAPQESLEMKRDDKFFTRIMSKETSMANSSCRVYYGGASGAIPFMWESQPGTPKHILADSSKIPPLTPPPSYYSTSMPKSKRYMMNIKPNLLRALNIFPPKKTNHSPSSSMSSTYSSSSSSSSSSSIYSSPSTLVNSKFRKRRCFSCATLSPVRCINIDGDHD